MGKIRNFYKYWRFLKLKLEKSKPVNLPQTKDEFDAFVSKVLLLSHLETEDSYVQAIATMIMHVEQTEDKKSLDFFVKSLRKSIANQVSYEVIDSLRQKAKAKKQQEVTPETPGDTIVEPPQEGL